MTRTELDQLIAQIVGLAEGGDCEPTPQAAKALQDLLSEPGRPEAPGLSSADLAVFASGGIGEADLPRVHAALLADPALLDEAMLLVEQLQLVRDVRQSFLHPDHRPSLTREDLAEFLAGRRSLSAEEQQLLFRSAELRADFAELKRQRAAPGLVFEMPSLAAASTDRGVDQRSFPGGSARITSSRRGDRVYVNFTFDSPELLPARFQIEREDKAAETLETVVAELAPTPGKAVVQLVLRPDDPLVRLLRAPDATGLFLRE